MQRAISCEEEVDQMIDFLTRHGLRLKTWPSRKALISFASYHVHLAGLIDLSHSEIGRKVVDILSEQPIEEVQRKRLEAIAGTLVGNYATAWRSNKSG